MAVCKCRRVSPDSTVTSPIPIQRMWTGWLPPFATLVHKGRRSGKVYRTPVNVFNATVDGKPGFAILLTYGPDRDWLKNITAAGGCRMRHNGKTFDVGNPKVVSKAEAASHMNLQDAIGLRPAAVRAGGVADADSLRPHDAHRRDPGAAGRPARQPGQRRGQLRRSHRLAGRVDQRRDPGRKARRRCGVRLHRALRAKRDPERPDDSAGAGHATRCTAGRVRTASTRPR